MKKLFLSPSVILVTVFLVTFSSCKKDDTINPNEKSKVSFEFDNIAGSVDLTLNTTDYTNAAGESFKVTKFDYYVSNIELIKTDGTVYTVPQNDSYFLVKEDNAASQKFTINNVPVGDYNKVRFVIGVDSLRNTLDVSQRTGVLDPAAGGLGMYWSWNSGYIFVKLEGTSPASTRPGNTFQYHIGGFGGMTARTINNIKTTTLDFPVGSTARVRVGTLPEIHVLADVLKMFRGTTNVSIAANPVVMFTAASVNVANNYQNMFLVDHVHN